MIILTTILLYDNSSFVPQDIASLLGVNRFSDIYYRKRSLDQWVSDTCISAGIKFIDIRNDSRARDEIKQLRITSPKNLVVMYLPAFLTFGCSEDEAADFLRKLSFTRSSLAICSMSSNCTTIDELRIGIAVDTLALELLRAVEFDENIRELIGESLNDMKSLKAEVEMIDMRDPLHFTDYLTSNFDVRFFNSVQAIDNFVLIKKSTELKKLKREYQYYGLLPPALQMFFIQPYDFMNEGDYASYKMERLFVPDMALQWIHGSLDELSLSRFLDKVFFYISNRSIKQVDSSTAKEIHDEAYYNKVKQRLEQLKAQSEFRKLKPYLDVNFGSVDILFDRYFKLFESHGRKVASRDLRIGHGDLCFSNILYSKTTGLMRFIDPRGADDESDLYMSPYYDLAKLSHSISGNYDFINYGLCRLEIDSNLEINLTLEPGGPAWAKEMFEERLRNAGYDPIIIRLFEASLFLSMVPLHIDSPKKVLAFLINAEKMITELEGKF